MKTSMFRLFPSLIKSLWAIFLAIGLALLVLVLPSFSHLAFAAPVQSTMVTCAQSPTAAHCDGQDPEVQGCATDARTLAQADILENGFRIGSVERRYSPTCQAWWGRVFDTRLASHANMYIAIAGTTLSRLPTFVSNQYRILYSFLVFDAHLPMVPEVTGSLEIDGVTPSASATLPSILIPANN